MPQYNFDEFVWLIENDIPIKKRVRAIIKVYDDKSNFLYFSYLLQNLEKNLSTINVYDQNELWHPEFSLFPNKKFLLESL